MGFFRKEYGMGCHYLLQEIFLTQDRTHVSCGKKNPPANARDMREVGFDPWVGKIPLEEDIATHCSILAWKIPWTEDPGRLQSIGSQRVILKRLVCTHARLLGEFCLFNTWSPSESSGKLQSFHLLAKGKAGGREP